MQWFSFDPRISKICSVFDNSRRDFGAVCPFALGLEPDALDLLVESIDLELEADPDCGAGDLDDASDTGDLDRKGRFCA